PTIECSPREPGREEMIRVPFLALLVIGLTVGTLASADDPVPDQPEPPVRLKKKVKPQPESAPDQRPEPSPKKEPLPKKTEPAPKAEEPKEAPEPTAQEL